MRGFRFIHAADLHLDSPFAGLSGVPETVRLTLRNSTFDAFNGLVELAIDLQADFVLIAGDVYESADRSLRAQVRFQQGLEKLASRGISAYVVHGNHDPADGRGARLVWPEAVHFFPAGGEAERMTVMLPDRGAVAEIWGISYPTAAVQDNYALRFGRPAADEGSGLSSPKDALDGSGSGGSEDSLFRIGLLHANVDGGGEHADYAPCTLRDLLGRGMDYWALGHVHGRRILHERPYVVYPGNIQGRSIRETGAKGCYVVDVDGNGEAALQFHPLDSVRWHKESVSITGLETEQELKDRLEGCVEAAREVSGGRPAVLRVELEGRGPLHRLLQGGLARELAEELRHAEAQRTPFVWIENISVHTGAEADYGALASSTGFMGDVLRLSEELLQDRKELLAFAGECMRPLLEHPRAGTLLRRTGLSDSAGEVAAEAAEEWLRSAAEWLLDRLLGEEDEA